MSLTKMRQAVMSEPGKIAIENNPVPSCGDGDLLVKVMRIGVCGSDIHVYHGQHPYTPFPVVQGHETCCVVEETGSAVSGFAKGDVVTFDPQVSCGECFPCKNGLYNICDSLKVIGFQTTGAASDYFVIPAAMAVKLPEGVSYDEGAMMEPLAVAVRAVSKAGNLCGKNAVVLGAGPIGNLVAQTAKAQGASQVLIVDINEYRMDLAVKCGVDFKLNPLQEDLGKKITELWGAYRKADVIFECAGSGATMKLAVENARKGSDIIVVAVFGKSPEIDMATVNEAELRLIGTARYNLDDFKTAINLVQQKKIQLEPLIKDWFTLEDYDDAYQKIAKDPGNTMKVMIKVND